MSRKITNFVLLVLLVLLVEQGYCLNLDKLKIYFLNGDYKSAIIEGEKLLATQSQTHNLDELYYILGVSYLKDGNYLRASDIFEIVLKEFKDSAFRDEASLGLGDTYFLRDDYDRAKIYYTKLINSNIRTGLEPLVYYRLSQCAFKEGNTQEAKAYLDKLKKGFPLNLETKLNKDLRAFLDFYTVQIGSFANSINATNLCSKLISRGYDAYIQETDTNGKKIYRVRVGRLRSRWEAAQLKNRLSSEGYPTDIVP